MIIKFQLYLKVSISGRSLWRSSYVLAKGLDCLIQGKNPIEEGCVRSGGGGLFIPFLLLL